MNRRLEKQQKRNRRWKALVKEWLSAKRKCKEANREIKKTKLRIRSDRYWEFHK